ncbi:MAG: alpha/beta hydrolase, partial [Oscillospiraceae bacterium]
INSNNGVVVVLHGGPGSGAQPLMDLPAFQALEKEFSCVYFDQRGSGKSEYDLTNELSIKQITQDVKSVVDYCKEEFAGQPVYLWGGSFGGLLSLLFLEKYPTAVDKAIISSPAIHIASKYTQQFQLNEIKSTFPHLFGQENLLYEKIGKVISNATSVNEIMDIKEFSDWIFENRKPMKGFEGLWHAFAMRKWMSDTDMRSSIKNIQIKTLFLMGVEDPIIPANELIEAVAEYKNDKVDLKLFSPCGHAVFEDCKDEFVKTCKQFYTSD